MQSEGTVVVARCLELPNRLGAVVFAMAEVLFLGESIHGKSRQQAINTCVESTCPRA
jgi:hypothetical protein